MPLYAYHCKSCEETYEYLLKVSDPHPCCPKCKEPMTRGMGSFSVRFRGGSFFSASSYREPPPPGMVDNREFGDETYIRSQLEKQARENIAFAKGEGEYANDEE